MNPWAYSGNVYDASGPGTTAFSLVSGAGKEIKYLQRSHIHVYTSDDNGATWVELSSATGFAFNTAGTEIVLTTGIAAGQWVKVQRLTPIGTEYIEFMASSQLTADQLNIGEEFSMYGDQELYDWLNVLTGGESGPGNPINLDNLGDVSITDPAEEMNALVYDETIKKWTNKPSRNTADQIAGTPPWDDTAFATAGAIAERHDNFVQPTLPTSVNNQEGKFWFQDDANKTLSVWNGTGWISITSGGTFTTQPKVIYVDSSNGNDSDDGHRIISPKLTIKAAVEQANADTSFGDGSIILVVPGVYQEELPITITAQNLSIVGQSIRSVFVHPTTKTEEGTMFLCDSGSYINGFSFAGLKASGTRGAAGSVDPDPVYGLPPSQGWVGALRPGCVLRKSPYFQNCTVFSDINIDNDNFDPNNLGGATGGDITSGPTGGGLFIDGSAPAANSPLKSMVIDSFTQINLDGPGLFVRRGAYCQAVSFFSTFCFYHVKVASGGQVNLSACTTDFGEYGLIADGKSDEIFAGVVSAGPYNGYTTDATGAFIPGNTDIRISNINNNYTTQQPNPVFMIEMGGELYPILSATAVSGDESVVTVLNPNPTNKAQNLGLNPGTLTEGTVAKFYLRSQISSQAHTFEYAGAGTNYSAAPWLGGQPDTAKQAVELGGQGTNAATNQGKIYISGADELGRSFWGVGGDSLIIDQRIGRVQLPTGSVSSDLSSDLDPTLGADLNVNNFKIKGGKTGSPVGDIVLETDGSSTILLNGFSIPGDLGVDFEESSSDIFGGSTIKEWTKGLLTKAETIVGYRIVIDTRLVDPTNADYLVRMNGNGDYTFDWGDGNVQTETKAGTWTQDHTYSAPGQYTVTITVSNPGSFIRPYATSPNEAGSYLIKSVTGMSSNLNQTLTTYANAWQNNINMISVGPIAYGPNLTQLDSAFINCFNLTSFPFEDIPWSKLIYLTNVWANCTAISNIPQGPLNLSNVIFMSGTWQGNYAMSGPWPEMITTSALTTISSAWRDNAGITGEFPFFDTSGVTTVSNAWVNTSISGAFPALDLGECLEAYNMLGGTKITSWPSIDMPKCTSFNGAWSNCKELTSWGLSDMSSGKQIYSAWTSCSKLTAMPAGIAFPSTTTLSSAWSNCTSLTDFPANAFDTTGTLVGLAFNAAFTNCALTAASVENILVSLDANGQSDITLGLNGGTSAGKSTWTAAANNAYDSLIAKGWTIQFNA